MDKHNLGDSAQLILTRAIDDIGDRATVRDTEAERSMARTVKAFNAMFGKDLTETEGWQFMELLKMSRSVGGDIREDDYRDGAAYAALAGESAIASLGADEAYFRSDGKSTQFEFEVPPGSFVTGDPSDATSESVPKTS